MFNVPISTICSIKTSYEHGLRLNGFYLVNYKFIEFILHFGPHYYLVESIHIVFCRINAEICPLHFGMDWTTCRNKKNRFTTNKLQIEWRLDYLEILAGMRVQQYSLETKIQNSMRIVLWVSCRTFSRHWSLKHTAMQTVAVTCL